MTADEFSEWLASKGANKPCPFCDSNDWIAESRSLPSGSDKQYMLTAQITSMEKYNDGFHRDKYWTNITYFMTCSNCGFVRMHNMKVVEVEK